MTRSASWFIEQIDIVAATSGTNWNQSSQHVIMARFLQHIQQAVPDLTEQFKTFVQREADEENALETEADGGG